ncbi:MAG: CatB-related O-acetyltransferase [Sediminicola sp.]
MKDRIKHLILSNRFLLGIVMKLYQKKLTRRLKVLFGKRVFISFSSRFEGHNSIGTDSVMIESSIGYGSYISDNCYILKTRIGKYCSIGPHVKCIFGNHPTHTFVSTHPAFFSLRKQAGFTYTQKQYFQELSEPIDNSSNHTISIGNDVWIGANVTILDGIRIGNGAIVAANSLVNKDIPPYTIVAGLPAKALKKRFPEEQIAFLEEFKWWEKGANWISENADKFINISDFQKKFKHD